jgi:hypothetical protein
MFPFLQPAAVSAHRHPDSHIEPDARCGLTRGPAVAQTLTDRPGFATIPPSWPWTIASNG